VRDSFPHLLSTGQWIWTVERPGVAAPRRVLRWTMIGLDGTRPE